MTISGPLLCLDPSPSSFHPKSHFDETPLSAPIEATMKLQNGHTEGALFFKKALTENWLKKRKERREDFELSPFWYRLQNSTHRPVAVRSHGREDEEEEKMVNNGARMFWKSRR